MGLTERHWFENEDVPENYEWALEDAVYNSRTNKMKDQEAVKPIPPTDESDLWRCGNCNSQLFRCTGQRYCGFCGKQVKWNEHGACKQDLSKLP